MLATLCPVPALARPSRCVNTLIRPSLVTMAELMLAPTPLPALACLLSLLGLCLLLLLCVIRKKRRMEGTYRPSSEERKQTRAAGSEKPGLPLPLPKEERLIWPPLGGAPLLLVGHFSLATNKKRLREPFHTICPPISPAATYWISVFCTGQFFSHYVYRVYLYMKHCRFLHFDEGYWLNSCKDCNALFCQALKSCFVLFFWNTLRKYSVCMMHKGCLLNQGFKSSLPRSFLLFLGIYQYRFIAVLVQYVYLHFSAYNAVAW